MTDAKSPKTSQLPAGRQLFLDHVGHFVADAESAAGALRRAGFAPTPVSVQVNPDPVGGTPRLTGTGNVCAMLENGYLEMLFKTAETPLGLELDAARRRYPGLHLAAFAVADAPDTHERLARAGFAMQPVVDMRRPVDTATGPGTAAFSVVRLEPGQMPEGRIQMLRHWTEVEVWQPRWLGHPNTAVALTSLTIVCADVAEAGRRYERFLGLAPAHTPSGLVFDLDRGLLDLITAEACRNRWPDLAIPDLPFMAACGIGVRSLDAAASALQRGGLEFARNGGRLDVRFPADLGQGVWVMAPHATVSGG